jgi:hypothetical protein
MTKWRVLAMAAIIGVSACRGEVAVQFPGDTTGIIRPQALDSLASVVRQLNAIILADLRDISTDYESCEGPRTVLHFGNVQSLLGMSHTDTLQLRVFGGPLPQNRYVADSKSPRYVLGGKYLLFLFNTDWRFSPVISDHAYRVEMAAGKEVLIAPNGHAVTGVSPLGVETQTRLLFIPNGLPGVGEIRVTPSQKAQLIPCQVNPDGTSRCPQLPADTQPPREPPPPALWTPEPPNREDVVRTLKVSDLVAKIDSVAQAIGVTPGGYFAKRSRLECWNVQPTREPSQ